MFNPELVGVLCEKVSSEKDPQKLHEMNALLQAIIREDVEEIRLRLVFLAKTWGITIDLNDYGYIDGRSLSVSVSTSERQRKSDNATPKVATVRAKSISAKSDWDSGTESSLNHRHFGRTLVHEHAADSSSQVPAPSAFEIGCDGHPRDQRERSSGRRLRKPGSKWQTKLT
jgi:hypothetical protein